MADIRIRPARVDDARVLARLRYQFKQEDYERMASEPESFVDDCQRWIDDRLTSRRLLAWVAEFDGEVRGHVFLGRVEKFPSPFPGSTELGYITNFYVQPDQRNLGLGRALLDAVVEHCRANHFDTLIVWPSERSATLYNGAGFETPAELLELPIAQR